MTLIKNERLKAERNRQRFFASELIDALRGRHIDARWIPVSFEDSDRLEPEANFRPEQKEKFRTWGPAKRSVWTLADYRALEVYPNWTDDDGKAYRIVLGEPTLDALQIVWHRRGWVCAHCADAMRDEMPNHDLTCAWWWLMNSWAAVFVGRSGEFRRNEAVSSEHGKMAVELLEGAHVLPAS